MTKRIAILGCLLASIFFLATAEKRNVSMDFHQKMKPGTHTGVDRAPARINLEVYYMNVVKGSDELSSIDKEIVLQTLPVYMYSVTFWSNYLEE